MSKDSDTCDYLTNERLSNDQPHLSPACVLCGAPVDSLEHVLEVCRAAKSAEVDYCQSCLTLWLQFSPCVLYSSPTLHLTQFILDCTSLNLPDSYRIPAHNPNIPAVFKVSRDWTYAIGSERLWLLKQTHRQ